MDFLSDISVAVGLMALLLGSLEGGFRMGKSRASEADQRMSGQVGAVQGATLGLLGLLLGFSFAAAGARFLERQDLIVQEANALGTAALRADLLESSHRADLRGALQRYTQYRVDAAASLRDGTSEAMLNDVQRQQAEIWNAALAGVRARPETTMAVLNPVNEVIDLHTLRLAAGKKHVPMLVLGLLVACSVLATFVIGFGFGLGGRRRAQLTLPLALVITAALWITIDLDHPRAGLLLLSDAPLRALKF